MSDPDSVDVDRGWAFVIAFSYFMTKVILMGISYPSSVFYTAFLEEFEQSPSTTAWATSLNTFAFCFFGELANVISSSLGCRTTVIIGCVMSSVGMMLTSFAPNLPCVIFAYSLLTGVGFCVAFMPSYPMVAFYFKKYRKLVFVLGGMGYGLGVFVFPLLSTVLIERYHWRGAFMILSAVNLNMMVIGATYFLPRTSAEKPPKKVLLLPQEDVSEKRSGFRRAFAYVRHSIGLLKHKRYCLYLVSYIMYGVGSNAFYTHVGNVAVTRGFTKEQAALLPSVVGIAGIVGRLPIVLFTHVLSLHVIGIFVIHFTLIGFSIAIYGFVSDFYLMIACCAAVGFLLTASAVQPEMVIKIIGLENLSTGISYSYTLFAVGNMLGGPLSAWVYEKDPSYRGSFILSGSCFVISGLMNIPSWLSQSHRRNSEVLQLSDE